MKHNFCCCFQQRKSHVDGSTNKHKLIGKMCAAHGHNDNGNGEDGGHTY